MGESSIIGDRVYFGSELEGAACYAGLLLAPAEGFGQGIFLAFGQKNIFLPWPLPEGQAMVLPPPCRAMGTFKITDENRHV